MLKCLFILLELSFNLVYNNQALELEDGTIPEMDEEDILLVE
jgi:hypothetical protein